MSISPFRLIDPELVVPSSASATKLEFWARLSEWSDDRNPKAGQATLSGLGALAADPPRVPGLAEGDFWTILSKFMSRGFTPSQVHRPLNEDHLRATYAPHLGAADNIDRLIDDLRTVDPLRRVALSGVADSWTATHPAICTTCESDGVSHIRAPSVEGGACLGLARAWRLAYRDEYPSDASGISEFAADMFPNLEFSRGAWNNLGSLGGAPDDVVRDLIHHLGVLNDSSREIWKSEITTKGREAALGARGVSASLEGPKTHKNKSAMKHRDFVFKNGTIRCEWHSKMKPNVNRVYFAIEEDTVYVGSIVDHLPV